MNLYYSDGNRQVGPIGKSELHALIKSKKVNARTLIWQPGMDKWQELAVFVRNRSGKSLQKTRPTPPVRQFVCSECGQTFFEDEMIRFNDLRVCAVCKPLFIQKIKEGVPVIGAMDYAGFWTRFAAIAIDGFIMWILNLIIFIPIGFLMPTSAENPFAIISFLPVLMLFQYAVPAAYDTWFVGKYAATPGKMVCKLKVIVADGSRLSYARAFGRHLAKWLSSMILLIGYIMAAFDDEKRALHDRVCETRVIRK